MFSNHLNGLRRHSKEKPSNVVIFCLFNCSDQNLFRVNSDLNGIIEKNCTRVECCSDKTIYIPIDHISGLFKCSDL